VRGSVWISLLEGEGAVGALVKRADQALYMAKEAGWSRVVRGGWSCRC
jgi:GGDEF domain-containing protein